MDKIVIHCSDSPNDREVRADEIHRWHTERKFDGIGYHHVICRDGEVQAGRPHYWSGAHVAGHNSNSVGICLIGSDEFTTKQWGSLKKLLYWLKFTHQGAAILGHNELDEFKTCPNFDVKGWLEENMPGVKG